MTLDRIARGPVAAASAWILHLSDPYPGDVAAWQKLDDAKILTPQEDLATTQSVEALVVDQSERAHMTPETKFEPCNVNVRIKISALWTSMLFIFAYVDLFSLYRPDFRADLEAGKVGGFTVNQSFLLGTTAYVVIPSLMVFCALILRPRVNRIANVVLGVVYALTIIAAAIGEWNYFILGSAVEVAQLAALVYYAWTWPKQTPRTSTAG